MQKCKQLLSKQKVIEKTLMWPIYFCVVPDVSIDAGELELELELELIYFT